MPFSLRSDVNAVAQAVSHSAIVTAYQESVPVVHNYIVAGVAAVTSASSVDQSYSLDPNG